MPFHEKTVVVTGTTSGIGRAAAESFRLMRAAAPHLAEQKGSVVNVSSVNGL
jgi:NAD(P)-dependent dehydrogenase (short-subunit alcohol dehydrogenase family)